MKTHKQISVLHQLHSGKYTVDTSGDEVHIVGPNGVLKPDFNTGYARVSISDPFGKEHGRARRLNVPVHIAVVLNQRLQQAIARGEDISSAVYDEGMEIDHLDGVRKNNHPDNLALSTKRENNASSRKRALPRQITPEQASLIPIILERYPQVSIPILANALGVHVSAILRAL